MTDGDAQYIHTLHRVVGAECGLEGTAQRISVCARCCLLAVLAARSVGVGSPLECASQWVAVLGVAACNCASRAAETAVCARTIPDGLFWVISPHRCMVDASMDMCVHQHLHSSG